MGAVGGAVHGIVRFHAVTDDSTAAVLADGRQLLNGAFEAVEDVPIAAERHFKGLVVGVAATFADSH
jgi:hypothetical protein